MTADAVWRCPDGGYCHHGCRRDWPEEVRAFHTPPAETPAADDETVGAAALGVLRAVAALTAQRGYPPTVREIGDAVGLTSTSTVHGHLRRLRRLGRLTMEPDSPRTIRVVG